jgi:hypothetical protein
VKRINVSAAFFLSIEFQETGFFLYKLYEASFGREPTYAEFIAGVKELSRGVVVGQGDWQAQIQANRAAFVAEWVKSREFAGDFDGSQDGVYVDKLFFRAGLISDNAPIQPERDTLAAALNAGTKTRTQVLIDVVELPAMSRLHFLQAFVLMEYFGYLRRNPQDAPDSDRSGYNFWLNKIFEFEGDYIKAELVKAFISSDEYRHRFGQ